MDPYGKNFGTNLIGKVIIIFFLVTEWMSDFFLSRKISKLSRDQFLHLEDEIDNNVGHSRKTWGGDARKHHVQIPKRVFPARFT